MKKILWSGFIVLISACCFVAGVSADNGQKDTAVKPTITLATNGVSDYVIVVPDGDDPRNRVKKASDLLQAILTESVGCNLPVLKEAEAPADKPHIYLGKTRAAKDAGVPVDKLKEWTFCKRVVGGNLFLAGLDASANITNRADKEYLGTFKAVISFLEDEVGVRFFLPGTNGLYVPKLVELKVDAGLNVTAAPKIPFCYDSRYGRSYGSYGRSYSGSYSDVTIANNYFDMVFYKTYVHSYYDAVPVEKYAETHPEYFVLAGGKRVPEFGKDPCYRNHLCISNPEVQELMLKEMEKQLDLGYEWVGLGQTDCPRACECDKCKTIAGDDQGEAFWIVHRKLAEEMKKRRPGKKIVILAYQSTALPPKTFKEFPDNVIIQMCSHTPEAFEMWKKFPCDKLVYVYNWGSYQTLGFLPKRSPAFAGKQLRLFAENNVKGIYKDGFGECPGLEGPVYYVYGKLLFDPSADPQKLADDFYRVAYGKAYVPMKVFFDAMYKRLDFNNGASVINVLTAKPEDQICYIFTPELILLMEDNLKRAFETDSDPRVQARLRLVQREFVYLKNMVSIFTYYRAYRLGGSWAAFDLLEAELDKRNALIDSWYVENEKAKTDPKAPKLTMQMEDGFSFFGNGSESFWGNISKDLLKKGGLLSGTLSVVPPFTWNMKKMRETKKLAGAAVKPKSLKAVRLAQPPAMNGVPDEEAWRKASVEELGELNLGTLKEGTSFRVAYDEANIYFAFVCKYAGIEQAEFAPRGRDGNCWETECLEIFIDPFGTREKKYHFIFNPVPESCYDDRLGFIDDILDPMFGKADVSWNGAWEYAAKADKENKCWTAEVKIPFAALGVSTPQPGTKWTMDVARNHHYLNKATGKTDQELSSWSPNLEGRGFGNLGGFGTILFE